MKDELGHARRLRRAEQDYAEAYAEGDPFLLRLYAAALDRVIDEEDEEVSHENRR